MWFLSNPQLVYSSVSVIKIIGTDVLGKVIGVSLNGLNTAFTFMASANSNYIIQKYKDELEILDIELKLKLVEIWLKDIDLEKIKINLSMELIYIGISDACHQISKCIEQINLKINYHNSKWFQSWRNIYLDEEVNTLKKYTKILNDRIKLLNFVNINQNDFNL